MTEAPPDFAQNRHLRQGGVTSRLQPARRVSLPIGLHAARSSSGRGTIILVD